MFNLPVTAKTTCSNEIWSQVLQRMSGGTFQKVPLESIRFSSRYVKQSNKDNLEIFKYIAMKVNVV